jgi:hypothetical protein
MSDNPILNDSLVVWVPTKWPSIGAGVGGRVSFGDGSGGTGSHTYKCDFLTFNSSLSERLGIGAVNIGEASPLGGPLQPIGGLQWHTFPPVGSGPGEDGPGEALGRGGASSAQP